AAVLPCVDRYGPFNRLDDLQNGQLSRRWNKLVTTFLPSSTPDDSSSAQLGQDIFEKLGRNPHPIRNVGDRHHAAALSSRQVDHRLHSVLRLQVRPRTAHAPSSLRPVVGTNDPGRSESRHQLPIWS